ncbi:MAG: L-asparaginase / beta-aspartyl-peptidase [Thermomicrobiales bacterium]|nr:L-asparaginase / beta-aspartyl-peptidase [Thermomicrobiales bacterium]
MTPIAIASANGSVGIRQAVDVLRSGGSAGDAVVAGIKPVEANPDDHSVGFSGLPNLLGEVELDASIMDGRGLRAGSIGALKNHQDAIELARRVMEELPHVLIVGEGAEQLAQEVGLPRTDLLTEASRSTWLARFEGRDPLSPAQAAYYTRIREIVGQVSRDPELPEPPHGTVNFIARDCEGNLACGVSTSGWAWKYPGRLGDSPIVGAGNYADNRWGAAACTGRGEMAQRACTAHSVVTFLRFGLSLDEAVTTAMTDLRALDDPYASEMNVIALDPSGRHAAASTSVGKTYIYMSTDMDDYVEAPRLCVPLDG